MCYQGECGKSIALCFWVVVRQSSPENGVVCGNYMEEIVPVAVVVNSSIFSSFFLSFGKEKIVQVESICVCVYLVVVAVNTKKKPIGSLERV